MSLLLRSQPTQCDLSTGGIRRFLITNRADISALLYQDDNFNLVTALEYPAGSEAFFINIETAATETRLTETLNRTNGDIYDVQLVSNLVRLDEDKRQFLEELTVNAVFVIIEDRNGIFWVLGFDAPFRLTAYEAGTDGAGGVSQYNFTISGKSRYKMRQLDEAAANDLNVLVVDCSIYAGSTVSAVPGVLSQYFNCLVSDFF